MTTRHKRQRRLWRALSGVAAVSILALLATQMVTQSEAQSCGAGHGTVAAASSQQYVVAVSAAHAGNPEAMIEVAQMYRDGLGVERDLVVAHAWLKLASQKGASAHFAHTISTCLSKDQMRLADAKVLALLQEEDDETW